MDNWEPIHIIAKRYVGILPGTFRGLSTDATVIGVQELWNRFGILDQSVWIKFT
jgi:hypothetical protein